MSQQSWAPAEAIHDGQISIIWDDGSLSDVPADYVRKYEETPQVETNELKDIRRLKHLIHRSSEYRFIVNQLSIDS